MSDLREYADYLWRADDLEQADLEETCRRLKNAQDRIEELECVLAQINSVVADNYDADVKELAAMSEARKVIEWLSDQNIPVATKQLMIDGGLNVFGFDLAMESFNRHETEMPDVFAYEHENGVLLFVRRPTQEQEK